MRKSTTLFLIVAAILMAALAACGGGADAPAAGRDVDAGEKLFAQPIIGAQPGCITCHSLTADEVLVGPSMAAIASRAGTRISGTTAEDYILQSILHPDDYIVEGFTPGVMVQVWEEELTPEQIDNLVAYLLTLE